MMAEARVRVRIPVRVGSKFVLLLSKLGLCHFVEEEGGEEEEEDSLSLYLSLLKLTGSTPQINHHYHTPPPPPPPPPHHHHNHCYRSTPLFLSRQYSTIQFGDCMWRFVTPTELLKKWGRG